MRFAFVMVSLSALAFSASAGAVEVSCENEAGSCTVGDDKRDCSCLDGSSGMPDNRDPNGERSREEMEVECEELLVMVCGERLPDPSEDCTEDQLEICTAFLSASYLMDENCYEVGDDEGTSVTRERSTKTNSDYDAVLLSSALSALRVMAVDDGDMELVKLEPRAVSGCCETLNEVEEDGVEMQMFRCVAEVDSDDCEAYLDCVDEENTSGGDDSNNSLEKAEKEVSDDDDGNESGCSFLPISKKASYSLFSLVTILFN